MSNASESSSLNLTWNIKLIKEHLKLGREYYHCFKFDGRWLKFTLKISPDSHDVLGCTLQNCGFDNVSVEDIEFELRVLQSGMYENFTFGRGWRNTGYFKPFKFEDIHSWKGILLDDHLTICFRMWNRFSDNLLTEKWFLDHSRRLLCVFGSCHFKNFLDWKMSDQKTLPASQNGFHSVDLALYSTGRVGNQDIGVSITFPSNIQRIKFTVEIWVFNGQEKVRISSKKTIFIIFKDDFTWRIPAFLDNKMISGTRDGFLPNGELILHFKFIYHLYVITESQTSENAIRPVGMRSNLDLHPQLEEIEKVLNGILDDTPN